MSVENLSEHTTHTDVVERLEKEIHTEAEADTEITEKGCPTAIDEVLPPALDHNHTGDGEISMSRLATDWYRGLTFEEQAGAISFSDGAFLGAFLAFASPWSIATAATEDGGGEPVRDVDVQMDWEKLVPLTEFESKYDEIDGSLMNTPLLRNRKGFDVGGSIDLSVAGKSRADDHDVERGEENTGIESSVPIIEREPSERELLVPPADTDNDSVRRSRQRFFDQVAVIFPSAFKHISGGVESHPHVAVRPSYFANTIDEENIFAFSCSSCFESFDSSDNPRNWLKRLYHLNSNGRATLSSLLIARFEWAIWASFLKFEHHGARIRVAESSGSIVVPNNVDGVRTHLLSSLGDVLSHCGAMNDLSMTIDSTTLSRFISPFINACQLNDVDAVDSNQIENVILTPLYWVLNANERGVSLGVLDLAVDASLSRMENHGPEPVEPDVAEESRSSGVGISGEGKSTFSPKKKKKKSKKKKKKKVPSSVSPIHANIIGQEAAVVDLNENVEDVPEESDFAIADDCIETPPEIIENATESTEQSNSSDMLENGVLDSEVVLPDTSETVTDDEENEDETDTPPDDIEALVVASVVALDMDATIEAPVGTDTVEASNVDGDSWETVEVRGRGNRKKPVERHFTTGPRLPIHFAQASGSLDSHNAKKLKSPRVVVTPKKKVLSRKIVREILFSLVDSIEEESRKRKQSLSSLPRAVNSWRNGPPGAKQQQVVPVRRDFASSASTQLSSGERSLRDIVVGSSLVLPSIEPSPVPSLGEDISMHTPEAAHTPKSQNSRREDDSVAGINLSKRGKSYAGILADQNTAPTYQETISASSNARLESKEDPPNSEDRKSDSSSLADTTEEAPLIRDREVPLKLDTTVASTPPLPTLLSPENANSATSSVASSLEAPHAGRMHHHSVAASGVNDVGYHLLDVCDRLSRDMSLFMSRRALALSARRRERGAILAALQDSVSSLWPRQCHVELYGSCATQLDLPSSDIDVVVLGLDRPDSMFPAGSDSIGTNLSLDDSSLNDEGQHPQHFSPPNFGMMPMHRNAERILRLAADLESQAWAVQVNAIPTASVPVVKVLADPSKLTSNGGEWLAQHQHMAAQVAAAAGKCQSVGSQEYPNPEYNSYPHPTHLPWRGSDVMKGLLSLDITFEGPEHGGIGSTDFSSRIVIDACAESGLHPDATPFVQVLMVLKELLCQRKLNEPYSGGLSSYALLLLVLALVRERAVIREEIELVEQQKRAMCSVGPSAFGTEQGGYDQSTDTISVLNGDTLSPKKVDLVSVDLDVNEAKRFPSKLAKEQKPARPVEAVPKKPPTSANPPQISWASVAKTSVSLKATYNAGDTGQEVVPAKASKKPSFADALTRSSNGPALSGSGLAKSTTKNSAQAPLTIPTVASRERSGADMSNQTLVSAKQSPPTSCADVVAVTNPSAQAASPLVVPEVSPLGNSNLRIAPPFYPQGYNDIVEVLCSGEPTAGKLLMHFLLFYGQHFDAQSTAIDVSGKHEREYDQSAPFSYMSPFIQRRARGNIDPITGMLTVDPIVIFDPLEGAENNNVARRCFAWNSVRWIFAQSYATLASAVERSATPPSTPGGNSVPASPSREGRDREAMSAAFVPEAMGDLSDPTSPLLKCLLSF